MSNNSGKKRSRREVRREQLAREKRMRRLRIWVPLGVIVIALVGLAIYRANEPEVEGVNTVAAAESNQHDDSLQIPFGGLPPTGGPHSSVWQNCGIYTDPVAPENVIHSMEHGAVWVTYHPELPEDQVTTLQNIVRGDGYVLLSPYPDQNSPIVLTVWDKQLQVDSADDDRIEEFIDRYRRRRGPEPAAACNGGIGTPVG